MTDQTSSSPPSAADTPSVLLTTFENAGAAICRADTMTWAALVERLQTPPSASEKSRLPWLKLARFGALRTFKNSLRHDANVEEIYGVEGDYDGESVSPAEAIMMLERHVIKALVYTSPSHTDEKPRWRVVAPLSHPHPPSARDAILARLNGALGGILSAESFTLSQSYYFGVVPGLGYQCRPTFDDPTEGSCLDELDELDEIAIGRPRHAPADATAGRNSTWSDAYDRVIALGRKLKTGDGRRDLLKSYIGSRSVRGFDRREIRALIDGFVAQFFDAADPPDDNDVNGIIEWAARRDDIRRRENAELAAGILAKSRETSRIAVQSGLSPEDLRALQKQPKPVEIKKGEPVPTLPFPVEVLNEALRWVSTYRSHTHPLLSQAAILAAASAAGGRRYLGHAGRPTHLYLSLLTNSTSESHYALHAAEKLMFDAGLRACVRSHRFTSPQQVYGMLNRAPTILYCADDYGDQLRFAKRQPSGLLEQTLALLAGRMREGSTLSLEWSDMGVKQPPNAAAQCVIYSPSVSILAAIAGSQIGAALKRSELSRGALDSMIFVPALNDDQWIDRPANAVARPPANVLERLRSMRGFGPDQTDLGQSTLLQSLAGTDPTPIAIRFTGPLDHAAASLIEKYRNTSRDIRSLVRGAQDNVGRVAAVLAIVANPEAPIATDEIVGWARHFVGSCLEATIAEYEMLGGGEEKSTAYDTVAEMINRYQGVGITRRQLAQFCHTFRSMETGKRQALIDQMIEDGVVFEINSMSGRTKALIHRQFVAQPDEMQIPQTTVEKGGSAL